MSLKESATHPDQPTAKPVRKVAAAGVAGSLAIVLTAVLGAVGVNLEPEVSAALATLVAFVAGYFAPEVPY